MELRYSSNFRSCTSMCDLPSYSAWLSQMLRSLRSARAAYPYTYVRTCLGKPEDSNKDNSRVGTFSQSTLVLLGQSRRRWELTVRTKKRLGKVHEVARSHARRESKHSCIAPRQAYRASSLAGMKCKSLNLRARSFVVGWGIRRGERRSSISCSG